MGDGAAISILLRSENKSFFDHSLPLLRSGCSVM
jgi:hypothetical protein